MTPATLAKSGTEHGHQAALFAYVAVAYLHGFDVADEWSKIGPQAFKKSPRASNPDGPPAVPALEWFHAIHNQGHGDKVRGANAKAEGVRKGVADTFLPVRRGAWSGLYIEMKKPSEKPVKATSKGGVSDDQAEFGAFVKSQGFGWIVCYSWEEAAEVLTQYLTYGVEQ